MSRELRILQASASLASETGVEVMVVSEDLKSRPVHRIELTPAEALQLARQLVGTVEQRIRRAEERQR